MERPPTVRAGGSQTVYVGSGAGSAGVS